MKHVVRSLTIGLIVILAISSCHDKSSDVSPLTTPATEVTKITGFDNENPGALSAQDNVSGWVTLGHEVRSFLPCNRDTDHWLLGESPALPEMQSTYRNMMADARPYTPLFMVLTGNFGDPPSDGFGAEYAHAFVATGLIKANSADHCRKDFIVVESPAPGAVIESPLSIRGRARGNWFFEGDFPIVLEDRQGNVVANGFVVAQGKWMTKEFVPFSGTLSFTRPDQGDRGALILKKDNPSENRELDDAMEIPVFFQE